MGNRASYPEVDLSGKVAVVTGGNTGIGYWTAKALARLGAHTFIACRSRERAEEALQRMKTELSAQMKPTEDADQAKEIKIEYLALDLSSFQSTSDFVRTFKEMNLPLHILVNNAGIAFVPFKKTDDGLESQLQVNYLSHVLLTLELLPILLDTAASSGDVRIVNVSSQGHKFARTFDPENLNVSEVEYSRFKQYGDSKQFNIMGSYALQRRVTGKNITVSSLCPGIVDTEITRGLEDRSVLSFFQRLGASAVGKSAEKGAVTSINCAVNPALNSQQHFFYQNAQPSLSSPASRNEIFQEQLWEKTFELLKDYLSPQTVENYGPQKEARREEETSGEQGDDNIQQ